MASAVLVFAAQQGGSPQNTGNQKKANTKTAKKPKNPKLSDDEAGTRSIPPRPAKKDTKKDKQ